MKSAILFAFLAFVAVSIAEEAKKAPSSGTTEARTKLLEKLLNGYNKQVNPDKTTVQFGISLINYDIVEDKNVLQSYVWLKYLWNDTRLTWDKEEFAVDVLRLDPHSIWTPDVTLYNSADPVNMANCWDSNVLIYPTGEVLWVPPCKLQSYCKTTLKKHPYDSQTCTIKFGSWTYDGYVLDIQPYVRFGDDAFCLKDLQKNVSPYDVVSVSTERHETFYSCCEEPYPDLRFNLTVKRPSPAELFARFD